MTIKLFVACEIQYFELGILFFNSNFYYLTRRFIDSTSAYNLLNFAFNLPTRAFCLPTCAFNLETRGFSVFHSQIVDLNSKFVTRVLHFHIVNKSCKDFPTKLCKVSEENILKFLKRTFYSQPEKFQERFTGKTFITFSVGSCCSILSLKMTMNKLSNMSQRLKNF